MFPYSAAADGKMVRIYIFIIAHTTTARRKSWQAVALINYFKVRKQSEAVLNHSLNTVGCAAPAIVIVACTVEVSHAKTQVADGVAER